MNKWLLYTLALGFAAYWASNLLLWFPWSYIPTLGIILMLTIAPLLWAYVTFLSLKTYPGNQIFKGAINIALIFLLLAVIMDYMFFGIIRNAFEQLYHPTTFYGYGFLIVWPFFLVVLFKNKISQHKKKSTKSSIVKTWAVGLIFFGVLTLIIVLGIEI